MSYKWTQILFINGKISNTKYCCMSAVKQWSNISCQISNIAIKYSKMSNTYQLLCKHVDKSEKINCKNPQGRILRQILGAIAFQIPNELQTSSVQRPRFALMDFLLHCLVLLNMTCLAFQFLL